MAKKRLNKNVVVGLTLFGFVLMIVLSIIMLSQLRKRDPAYFIVLAEQAVASDHWDQAAIFYKEAWRRSGDAKHLVKIGEALLEYGDVPNALLAWKQALVSQPNLLTAHRAYLEVLLELAELNHHISQWQNVLKAAEDMLDAATEDQRAELAFALHAKGLAMLNLTSLTSGFQAFVEYPMGALMYRGDLSSYSGSPFSLHISPINQCTSCLVFSVSSLSPIFCICLSVASMTRHESATELPPDCAANSIPSSISGGIAEPCCR